MDWIRIFATQSEALTRIPDGQPQLLILHGHRICLSRFHDQFFAVQDACSHNGESLSKGKINYLGEIVCPWHGYRFKLRSGQACDSSSPDLKTYPVKIDDTGFYVGI